MLLDDLIIPDKCPVFNKPFIYGDHDWTYSIDRLDNDKGYIRGNILIVSNKANRLKNNATMADLRAVVDFYEQLGEPNATNSQRDGHRLDRRDVQ